MVQMGVEWREKWITSKKEDRQSIVGIAHSASINVYLKFMCCFLSIIFHACRLPAHCDIMWCDVMWCCTICISITVPSLPSNPNSSLPLPEYFYAAFAPIAFKTFWIYLCNLLFCLVFYLFLLHFFIYLSVKLTVCSSACPSVCLSDQNLSLPSHF